MRLEQRQHARHGGQHRDPFAVDELDRDAERQGGSRSAARRSRPVAPIAPSSARKRDSTAACAECAADEPAAHSACKAWRRPRSGQRWPAHCRGSARCPWDRRWCPDVKRISSGVWRESPETAPISAAGSSSSQSSKASVGICGASRAAASLASSTASPTASFGLTSSATLATNSAVPKASSGRPEPRAACSRGKRRSTRRYSQPRSERARPR